MLFKRPPSPATIADRLTVNINSKKKNNHTCHFNTCTIVNLPVEIHKFGDNYAIRSKYTQKYEWFSKETISKKIYSIYLCKETGKIHYCHIGCDGDRMTNIDNCLVCCISGLQYESESVRSWQMSARCVQTVIADKGDPNVYSRDSHGRVRNSGIHNIKTTQCILMCKNNINKMLYSNERKTSEKRKLKDAQKEAEKTVAKYKRHCEKQRIYKNYIHMLTIYANQIKKRPLYTQFIMIPKQRQEYYIKQYTIEIIAYWKMILLKTTLGIETPSLFNFKNFVPACLYIMKNGLLMSGIYIISCHSYLDNALPEANMLDSYNVNKPAFTQSKNNILKSIRDIIENKKETPQSLRQFAEHQMSKLKF